MVVFVNILNKKWGVLDINRCHEFSGLELKRQISEKTSIASDDIYLTINGRKFENYCKVELNHDVIIQCCLKVHGGKGGFGSMLRAIGAQIEKTTNREACRDLSGRRMRDVNDEKKIADWLAKQAERDQEKARRKQERLERLQSHPKHVFEESSSYTNQLQNNMDSVDDALRKGLKSSKVGKRKLEEKNEKAKKQKLWLDIDEELSSDDEVSDSSTSSPSMTKAIYSTSEKSIENSGIKSIKRVVESVEPNENNVENTSDIKTRYEQLQKHDETPKIESENSKIQFEKSVKRTETSPSRNDDTCTSSNAENDKKLVQNEAISGKLEEEKSVTFPLNLDDYGSVKELEELGLDVLKKALISLGMKCGGTLQQRAERLFSVRGLALENIDLSLLAKTTGGKKNGKNK